MSGLLTFGIIALLISWSVAGRLVAPAHQFIASSADGLPADKISLSSDSGCAIVCWHIRAEDSNGVVVLLHGLRENRLAMVERAGFLLDAGYSVVMVDLQAHGQSGGKCITLGHLERHDVCAAVQFARREHPDEGIGLIGVSLGGAAATLASPLGIDAMVLESVFPTISAAVHNRVAAQIGVFSYVFAEILLIQLRPRLGIFPSQLRPIEHLNDVQCPLYLISGTEDRHTTAAETREMFAVAKEDKQLWLIEGAAHVDLHKFATWEYEENLLEFFAQHLR